MISSGSNESWTLDAKGSGTITLNGTATGAVLTGTLLRNTAVDSLTAHAGGGQGSALVLTKQVNRVTTVATSGDSVLLPASAAGLFVTCINSGANPMQVYGAGSDTINGVASGTGVSQMPGSSVVYNCVAAGAWFTEGLGVGYSNTLPTVSYVDGVTAHAGGGRGSAVAISTILTRVTTVGTAADSVVLPVAAPGLELTLINAAASNAMQVFANGSDTIDGTAGSTGYSQAAGKTVTYFSTAAAAWHKMISA